MPLTINHPFVSAKADSPAAAALGKILPSHWNSVHAVTGNLHANEIINIPFGVVTSVDVQAAINQLASLIPAPGPGTDPLSLTKWFNLSTFNPAGGPATDRSAASIFMITDCTNVQPTFANSTALEAQLWAVSGQANPSAITQTKETFFVSNMYGYYPGSGQKFIQGLRMDAFGMGDAFMYGGQNLQYSCGPVSGDEGVGWVAVSNIFQRGGVDVFTITSKPAQSIVNTTTTQAIIRSENSQTVTVASMAGAVVGDWVVVDQEVPTNVPNMEAVQIISFTTAPNPETITAVFRCNHLNGTTITPALTFVVNGPSGTFPLGQDRVLINLSQPSYSVGTVSSIGVPFGFTFNGAATGWANNMVGGYAGNIGAISLASDDYTQSPFDAGANRLRSWYQIFGVVNPTQLDIYTTSIAGDNSYRGKGVGTGAYTIRQCAKILHLVNSGGGLTGQVVCETSTSTWSLGDTIEQVICPYPDVTGFQYNLTAYTNGGTYRGLMNVRNLGPRIFDSVLRVDDIFGHGPETDGVSWNTILNLTATCHRAITIDAFCTQAAILLEGADASGALAWITSNLTTSPHIRYNGTNAGLTIAPIGGLSGNGVLAFAQGNTGENQQPNQVMMKWKGFLEIVPEGSGNQMIQLDRTLDTVNFEQGFFRWNNLAPTLEIGTELGGTGSARDFIVKTNGVENIRFQAGNTPIKFTASANFSANGGVATAVTGVGPAGASTTVQTWLTIVDNGGNTRYIPCF